MMKKITLQLFFALFTGLLNLSIELYPSGKIYMKYYLCNLQVSDVEKKIGRTNMLSFLKEEEIQLDMAAIKTQLCNKNQ